MAKLMKHSKAFGVAIFALVLALAGFIPFASNNASRIVRAVQIDNNTNGNSVYNDYFTYKIANGTPLFNANGTVNQTVVTALNSVLSGTNHANKTQWSSGKTYTVGQLGATAGYKDSTAADFSTYATANKGSSTATYGAVLIKLFPDVANKTRVVGELGAGGVGGAVTEFTKNSWYQLVYRSSQDGGNDILTLYAVNPYRTSWFNQNSAGAYTDDFGNDTNPTTAQSNQINLSYNQSPDYTYQYEGNYSTSIIRTNLARDWTAVNQHFASQSGGQTIDQYFVTPNDLPGKWQSSAFQTGTNKSGYFFKPTSNQGADTNTATDGIGASPYTDSGTSSSTYFSTNNGLDGLGAGYANRADGANGWAKSKIQSNYTDKISVPSSFETLHMGQNKDYDLSANGDGYVNSGYGSAIGSISNATRGGLWQLNGFDRAFSQTFPTYSLTNESSSYSWLRSGNSSLTNYARYFNSYGYGSSSNASIALGVRPTLHLTLSSLAQRARVHATNSGVAADACVSTPAEGGEAAQSAVGTSREIFLNTISGSPRTITFNAGTGGEYLSGDTTNGIKIGTSTYATIATSAQASPIAISGDFGYKAWYSENGSRQKVTIQLFNVPDATYYTNALNVVATPKAASTYSVIFDKNGGSGTNMENQTHMVGTTMGLSLNTYTRTGYLFGGWNTNAGGTGTNYANGAQVTNLASGGGSITLYAKWTPVTYTISFNSNGGSGDMASLMMTYDKSATLPANGFTRSGYNFTGWNTNSGGSGTAYAKGATISTNLTSTQGDTITLYAQWTVDSTPAPGAFTYTISYNANGGTGTTANSTHTQGVYKHLTANGFTKVGYTFVGWTKTSGGSTKDFFDNDNVVDTDFSATSGATIQLYAVWSVNSYTVVFNKNATDAFGTMGSQKFNYTDTTTALSANAFNRTGYTFAGWKFVETIYADKAVISTPLSAVNGAIINLYAQWTPTDPTANTVASLKDFGNDLVTEYNGKTTEQKTTAYTNAINTLKPLITNEATPTKAQLESAITAVILARDATPTVDDTQAITDLKALAQKQITEYNGYTDSTGRQTWNTYGTKITELTTLKDNASATAQQLVTKITEVADARKAWILAGGNGGSTPNDTQAIADAKAIAQKQLLEYNTYTNPTSDYTNAIHALQIVYDDTNATLDGLLTAIDNVVKNRASSPTPVADAVYIYKQIANRQLMEYATYSAPSDEYTNAINNLRTLMNKTNVTAEELMSAINNVIDHRSSASTESSEHDLAMKMLEDMIAEYMRNADTASQEYKDAIQKLLDLKNSNEMTIEDLYKAIADATVARDGDLQVSELDYAKKIAIELIAEYETHKTRTGEEPSERYTAAVEELRKLLTSPNVTLEDLLAANLKVAKARDGIVDPVPPQPKDLKWLWISLCVGALVVGGVVVYIFARPHIRKKVLGKFLKEKRAVAREELDIMMNELSTAVADKKAGDRKGAFDELGKINKLLPDAEQDIADIKEIKKELGEKPSTPTPPAPTPQPPTEPKK